jgi:hypothetical protein
VVEVENCLKFGNPFEHSMELAGEDGLFFFDWLFNVTWSINCLC